MSYESLLSYVVGFGSAIALFFFQEWWRKKGQKKKLARVLEVEVNYIKSALPRRLDSTRQMLEFAEGKNFGIELLYQKFDTHIYESLLKDLGVFKDETIQALRTFYGHLYGAEFWVAQNQDEHRKIEGLTGEKRKKQRKLTRTLAGKHLKALKESLDYLDTVLNCLKKEYS